MLCSRKLFSFTSFNENLNGPTIELTVIYKTYKTQKRVEKEEMLRLFSSFIPWKYIRATQHKRNEVEIVAVILFLLSQTLNTLLSIKQGNTSNII